ncbi:hypothetical protein GCM10009789_41380 [Kribbella sancticallisti]|uniref:3-methyl-2-oxobutanoate hydroxymethyltransferase n=1 Tax=Kribbella sancticallisti TaxID=460087 RepID=A0ABN2DTT6_9ACTN
MVDNFMSAGTNGDADDEMPAPYGTGPKNRTTEEHHRSDYGYAEADSGDGGWRERSTALDGLDPSPSLPNAPRSYERGPVPQQPYVPKPPFLPPPQDREYPTPSGYQQQYAEPSPYGESAPAWGERETYREPSYDESPFAPRPSYQERPAVDRQAERPGQDRPGQDRSAQDRSAQERSAQERSAQERPTQERPQQQYPDRPHQEQNPFRPQPQQGPPPQAQQGPFGPGRNGTSGPPQGRPGAPTPGSPAGTAPGQVGPAQPVPRPQAPSPASNGMTPHGSNGRSNGLNTPTPPPSPSGPPASNGLASSNGIHGSNGTHGSNGLGSNDLGSNGLGSNGLGSNGLAAGNSAPGAPQGNLGRAPGSGNPSPKPPAPSTTPAAPVTNQPTQSSTGWSGPAPTAGSAPPTPEASTSTGYPSDPSAEYESNSPVSSASQASGRPAGARRRADVQQDAPSQVQPEAVLSHRARRAQTASPTAESTKPPVTNSTADSPGSTTGSSGSSSSTPGGDSKRPRRYRIHHLRDMKNRGEKWAMLTAYDQYTAEIFDQSGIPVLLVGDSAANNVYGYESTLRVTVDELIPLARAVAGAVERALVVADLPFGSYQASPEQAFHTAVRFMKEAGVHAVKLEGGRTVVPAVEKLTQAGIPVMAHIGFTPQSEHSIGGYRVQGRGDQAAGLIDDAVALAEAGAFSVVLEMVPGDVSAEITKRIPVPTIGIGAGRETDAQVLVWQDMAGLRSGPMPRFVKQYADLRGILTSAATTYAAEVANGTFPADEHTF